MEHGQWSRCSELCGTSLLRFRELLGFGRRGRLESKWVVTERGKVDGVQMEETPGAGFAFAQPQKGTPSRMHMAGAAWREDQRGKEQGMLGRGPRP